MSNRSRLPFWITTVTTLALAACIRQAQPEVVLEAEETIGTDGLAESGSEETAVSDLDSTGRTREYGSTAQTAPNDPSPVDEQRGEGDALGRDRILGTPAREPASEPSEARVAAETKDDSMRFATDTPYKSEEKPATTPRVAPTPSPLARPSVVTASPPMGVVGGAAGVGVSGLSHSSGPVYAQPTAPPARMDLPPATTEGYEDYGVNDFVIVADDALSTFAIDVDTAAYTVSRRKLREGYLPPEAAVRVEEFVNYFPYEYRQPAAGDPFAVDFEAAPSPWNSLNTIVRVGVQGKKVSMEQRQAAHLTFLVDVSGSMRSADKIELLKKSLTMLTEELEDGDTVAIATYAGSTEIVLEPTPVSRKADIVRAIERLSTGGSTAMGAGIDLAYGLADAGFVEGSNNRVVICSDGDANMGQTSHDALSAQIRKYADKGIALTTLGFGNGNYQDTMMEQLANDGDGNYFYIDSEIEARRVLVDKMTSTLEVIAKDVKIQVDWNPGAVVAYRLIGYENRDVADVDFRNDKVDAGEIGAGHQVTALYEVVLKDDPSGSIATVRVRAKAPGRDAPATERAFTLPTSSIRPSIGESTDQFRVAFAASSFAEILRGSPYMAEVTLRDVEALARGAQRPEYREDAELVELIDRAATLKGETASYSMRHD